MVKAVTSITHGQLNIGGGMETETRDGGVSYIADTLRPLFRKHWVRHRGPRLHILILS